MKSIRWWMFNFRVSMMYFSLNHLWVLTQAAFNFYANTRTNSEVCSKIRRIRSMPLIKMTTAVRSSFLSTLSSQMAAAGRVGGLSYSDPILTDFVAHEDLSKSDLWDGSTVCESQGRETLRLLNARQNKKPLSEKLLIAVSPRQTWLKDPARIGLVPGGAILLRGTRESA